MSAWQQIAAQVRQASCVALFTDFDGTLAPIAKWPDQVKLSPDFRRLLSTLSDNDITVGVMSGRKLSDVQKRVGLRRVWYSGSHGLCVHRHGRPPIAFFTPAQRATMLSVGRRLSVRMRRLEGILLEQKGVAIAVHYRNSTERTRDLAFASVREVLEQYPQVHILRGKKAWELLPDSLTSKWTAIRFILRHEHRCNRPLVFYLGDDATDERVFAQMKGISVVVGRQHSTAARFFLHSPGEVKQFLERFCEVTA
jgi:trehalose 6-phosphate phosphatase